MQRSSSKSRRVLTIGVVVARTGRLAKLGDPLGFAMNLLERRLQGITNHGRQYDVRLVSRDSRSDGEGARKATEALIRDERAHVILTLAGTRVLPVVADTCEALGTACVSSTFPWQVYYYGRGATRRQPFRWTYHFCWGLDDIAAAFTEMWETVDTAHKVGCLWNDGPQGNWSRDPAVGFLPAATTRGYVLIDPVGYGEPAVSFHGHISAFLAEGVDVVTSAATGTDLALFRQQAVERGLCLRLITCSRWLAYPVDTVGATAAHAKIATLVYWTPSHPYRSSLDGMRAGELAEAYERATGNQWLQPLGLAYALFEVAAHALSNADDPTDRHAVAAAISRTRMETMAGPLDWTSGPVPNVATLRLAGGQWKAGRQHPYELAIVAKAQQPDIPLDGDLELLA